MIIIARCERCDESGEVSSLHYKDRNIFLCAGCEPKLKEFGKQLLRRERYADRGGVIYGSPWWAFNELTDEDRQWEQEMFGEEGLK